MHISAMYYSRKADTSQLKERLLACLCHLRNV